MAYCGGGMGSPFLLIKRDTLIEQRANIVCVDGEGKFEIIDPKKRDDRVELLKWLRMCARMQGHPIEINHGATYRETIKNYLNVLEESCEICIDDSICFILAMEHKDKHIRRFKALIKDIDGEIK